MLRNYLVVGLRNLQRNKLYALINVTGLAVSIAACLIIALYVRHELSFDRHHSKAGRIYRVARESESAGTVSRSAGLPALVGPELETYFPELEAVTRFVDLRALVRHAGESVREGKLAFADANVFGVFDIPLVHGDSLAALSQANSIVLSESAARRHFGDGEAVERLGRIFVLDEHVRGSRHGRARPGQRSHRPGSFQR